MKSLPLGAVAVSCLLVFVVSGAAEPSRSAALTAKQIAQVDTLVANIKRASRESFAKEDWSILAALFPPDTFACWSKKDTAQNYAFLSIAGIPDAARYDIEPIGSFYFGGSDTSRMGATHFIEISYSFPYMAKCGDQSHRAFPRSHFFLRPRGEGFELTYYCPAPQRDPGGTPLSATRARKIADGMTPAERMAIRNRLQSEAIPVGAVLGLQTQYGVSDHESYVLIDRICELTSGKAP